ncbi:MAG: ABC transporter ATP-binding protein [Balneolales bacterium]|nr:ABC transporter ATP-binding protein [Balneolales bacterium]
MLLSLDKIRKVYRPGSLSVEALKEISLNIDKGDFSTIMGSSGSGKSTLMNILGCLDTPTSGTYLLKGKNVSGFSKNRLADVRNRMIGFVFQNFHLLPRTSARENVELPLLYSDEKLSWKEMHKRAQEALEIVGLADRFDHTPNELSGGQQQRVAIARALVSKPSLLLADEPTGNLDSKTSLEIMNIFQQLNNEGLTILMVSHEPDIARFSKRITILRDGRIVSDRSNEQRNAATALENWKDETELLEHS